MSKQEVIESLKKYILLLNSEGILVYKAFLYGSYVNETANESSDIDVMIITGDLGEIDDKIIGKAWQLMRKVNSRIEPFIVGKKKFHDEGTSPLISLVKKEGLQLV